MVATVRTALTGWDVILALLVVIVAVLLDRALPIFISWVLGAILFLTAALFFALLFSF